MAGAQQAECSAPARKAGSAGGQGQVAQAEPPPLGLRPASFCHCTHNHHIPGRVTWSFRSAQLSGQRASHYSAISGGVVCHSCGTLYRTQDTRQCSRSVEGGRKRMGTTGCLFPLGLSHLTVHCAQLRKVEVDRERMDSKISSERP